MIVKNNAYSAFFALKHILNALKNALFTRPHFLSSVTQNIPKKKKMFFLDPPDFNRIDKYS